MGPEISICFPLERKYIIYYVARAPCSYGVYGSEAIRVRIIMIDTGFN